MTKHLLQQRCSASENSEDNGTSVAATLDDSANPNRDTVRCMPALTQLSSLAIDALMTMPPAQRNARLSLIDLLADLPKEELAILAKAVQPHLTDAEVARLCGVSRRTLYRWERYQRFKPRLADYRDLKRQYDLPDDSAA